MILINLGLSEKRFAIRHTQLFGSDVMDGLTGSNTKDKYKTNLFGSGYDGGDKVSIGCSLKGRVWSYKVATDIIDWRDWCRPIGAKLLDDSISIPDIERRFLVPQADLKSRPSLVPLSIDWTDAMYERIQDHVYVSSDSLELPFYEVELSLVDHSRTGPINFNVTVGKDVSRYEVAFGTNGPYVKLCSGRESYVRVGKEKVKVSEFLTQFPPRLFFEREAMMERGVLYIPREDDLCVLSIESAEAWDWQGTDISKESQGLNRRAGTIQHRVIAEVLKDKSWELVFDDDGSGEVADIVAARRREKKFIEIHFWHLKYCTSPPGNRVEDLYEVCGQAMKSVRWRQSIEKLMDRLKAREAKRQKKGGMSRLQRGSHALLTELCNEAPYLIPQVAMTIVQPGYILSGMQADHREVLGGTETFLNDYGVKLKAIFG
jgi:hypothetical protein